MRNIIYILLFYSASLFAQDIGGDYYVATDGDDEDAGTYAAPWATFDKAFSTAVAGDTVYFMEGTYYSDNSNQVDNSGSVNNYICFWAYPGDEVRLDCRNHDAIYNAAIYLDREEYVWFKELYIDNVYQVDSTVGAAISSNSCANLIFERISLNNIGTGRGYWTRSGAWGDHAADPVFAYDTTKWINCDVSNVCDTLEDQPGNSADAWKTVAYADCHFVWDGCRAWNYADDGIDASNITGGTQIVNECWMMSSNKYKELAGVGFEGNAFKMEGAYDSIPIEKHGVTMTRSLSMFNTGAGFREQDYNELWRTNGRYYNNTAYYNGTAFQGFGGDFARERTTLYRNNISYVNTWIQPGYEIPYTVLLRVYVYVESNNTWRWKDTESFWENNPDITLSDGDFDTLDSLTLVARFTAPRASDGSLPEFPLRLAEGSDLIDAGIQVPAADSSDYVISFNGSAPDIGAFEFTPPITYKTPYSGNSPIFIGNKIIGIKQD